MTFRSFILFFSLFLISFVHLRCTSSEEGVMVSLGVVHHPSADENGNYDAKAEGEPRVFSNNEDFEIRITKGYVALSSVEIEECATVSSLLRKMGTGLLPIENAWAHSESSSTKLGVPNVENIMREDLEVLELGHLEPAPGSYCHASVVFSPADADAEHLPKDIEMVGKTFYLEGTYLASGESETTEFVITSAETREKEIHFQNKDHEEIALELEAMDDGQSIRFGMMYDKWFTGVNFETMDEDEIQEKVFENIANSIHHHAGMVHTDDDHVHDENDHS